MTGNLDAYATMKSGSSQRQMICPPLACEEMVRVYMRDVDRTLIRENLKFTPAQRAEQFMRFSRQMDQIRGRERTRSQGQPTP